MAPALRLRSDDEPSPGAPAGARERYVPCDGAMPVRLITAAVAPVGTPHVVVIWMFRDEFGPSAADTLESYVRHGVIGLYTLPDDGGGVEPASGSAHAPRPYVQAMRSVPSWVTLICHTGTSGSPVPSRSHDGLGDAPLHVEQI